MLLFAKNEAISFHSMAHGIAGRMVKEICGPLVTNTRFRTCGRLECGSLRGDIVHIRLPHGLYTALPDRNIVPVRKKELLPDLPDVIHIHQKTLMTAQETMIPKFFFYGIQGLIDGVRTTALGMKNALGIVALDIQDLVVSKICHGGPLPDLVRTGGNIPGDPVHDHL